MNQTPTVEEFFAMPSTEDDDHEPELTADPLTSIAESLRVIAAVARPTALYGDVHVTGGESFTAELVDDGSEQRMREAFDDLEAKHAELWLLLAGVEKIVKPSTSKVSLEVKAAIDRWKSPVVPEAEGPDGAPKCAVCAHYFADQDLLDRHDCKAVLVTEQPPADHISKAEREHLLAVEGPSQPAHDASVEEWRAYARGHASAEMLPDIGGMNRSQIRTMLGIEQPASS